ncbi:MAG TPA: hypothetical protein VJ725_23960 [Thermoanaerobaculia bacterium]|nr:hypothetical protein [Thermoanaerobaculia bacterium]
MKKTSILLILLPLLTGCTSPAPDDSQPEDTAQAPAPAEQPSPVPSELTSPETVRETKTLTGEFIGFEAGDYLHAVIRQPDGSTASFFLERGMEIFLVDHQNQPLEFTYQVVDTDIPEAGGITTIERLHAIKAGDQTFADWWKTAEPNFGKLLDEYQPRIEKATLEPEEGNES